MPNNSVYSSTQCAVIIVVSTDTLPPTTMPKNQSNMAFSPTTPYTQLTETVVRTKTIIIKLIWDLVSLVPVVVVIILVVLAYLVCRIIIRNQSEFICIVETNERWWYTALLSARPNFAYCDRPLEFVVLKSMIQCWGRFKNINFGNMVNVLIRVDNVWFSHPSILFVVLV